MRRVYQVLALCFALGMLGFLACRAQKSRAPSNSANPSATPDAAAPVYLPATKSGAVFIDSQQAPR